MKRRRIFGALAIALTLAFIATGCDPSAEEDWIVGAIVEAPQLITSAPTALPATPGTPSADVGQLDGFEPVDPPHTTEAGHLVRLADFYTVWASQPVFGETIQVVFPVTVTQEICSSGWQGTTVAGIIGAAVPPFGTVIAVLSAARVTYTSCLAVHTFEQKRCSAVSLQWTIFGIPRVWTSAVDVDTSRCRWYAGV